MFRPALRSFGHFPKNSHFLTTQNALNLAQQNTLLSSNTFAAARGSLSLPDAGALSTRNALNSIRNFSIKRSARHPNAAALPTLVSEYHDVQTPRFYNDRPIEALRRQRSKDINKTFLLDGYSTLDTETALLPPPNYPTIGELLQKYHEKAQHEEKMGVRWNQAVAAASAAAVLFVADSTAQRIEIWNDPTKKFDWKRLATLTSFGLCYYGGFCFRLYRAYDYVLGPKRAMAKAVFDVGVHNPLVLIPAFYAWKHMFEGEGTLHDLKEKLKKDWWVATTASAAYWLPVQCLCFSFVPVYHRILFVSCGSFVHKTGLSWYAHRDHEAMLHDAQDAVLELSAADLAEKVVENAVAELPVEPALGASAVSAAVRA